MTARLSWMRKLPVLAIALVVLGSWSQVGMAGFYLINGDHKDAESFLFSQGIELQLKELAVQNIGGTNETTLPAEVFTFLPSLNAPTRAGSWSLSPVQANYTFVKFDGLTAIYGHGATSSFSFSLNDSVYDGINPPPGGNNGPFVPPIEIWSLSNGTWSKTSYNTRGSLPQGITPWAGISNVRVYWGGLGEPPPAVPEPLTLGLMASGMACAGFVIRKRRQN